MFCGPCNGSGFCFSKKCISLVTRSSLWPCGIFSLSVKLQLCMNFSMHVQCVDGFFGESGGHQRLVCLSSTRSVFMQNLLLWLSVMHLRLPWVLLCFKGDCNIVN